MVALSSFLSYKDIYVSGLTQCAVAVLPRAMRGHPRPFPPPLTGGPLSPDPASSLSRPCLVTFSDFHCLDTVVSSLGPTDRPSARRPYRTSVTLPRTPAGE
ncbi:hypothetical protein PAL_GLEAN10013300 [Pteropus alecto]|uniref:Uncharacterized protein n=1 Tax=Pteropus alecto TaxID=9402 RepID=L5KE93_PTEAL|nr:hypothetical protein PAL_GLEAN10013300 [Pteropus alecto]